MTGELQLADIVRKIGMRVADRASGDVVAEIPPPPGVLDWLNANETLSLTAACQVSRICPLVLIELFVTGWLVSGT